MSRSPLAAGDLLLGQTQLAPQSPKANCVDCGARGPRARIAGVGGNRDCQPRMPSEMSRERPKALPITPRFD